MKTLLRTIRIFDSKNRLSLTNLAMMIILYKLATTTALDWTTITTFFLALANYGAKRMVDKE